LGQTAVRQHMKKTFRTLSIICFSIISCSVSTNSSDKKNDLNKYGFNGKVKSVKSELFNLISEKDTFKIGNKENGIGIDKNLVLEFNQLGNLTLSKEFLANGDIRKETSYTYDKRDRLLDLREIDHYGKGSVLEYNYSYNSQDSITQLVIRKNDFKRTYKIERDEDNRPIKREIIQNDTISTYNARYDSNNNLISESEFDYENKPIRLVERSFNSQNLKEREKITQYSDWDTIEAENKYFYNKNNKKIVEQFNIENDSTFDETKYKYHKNGKLKESTTVIGDDEFILVEKNQYNENGDLTEKIVKTSDGETNDVWSYDFKYDSENNWIEKIEFKNDKPLRILKRTIDYYK